MSFTQGSFPIFPGAYMINGVLDVDHQNTNQMNAVFPIFSSIPDFSKYVSQNIDDYYLVLPGFKLEIYTAVNYVTIGNTFDNTGTTITMYTRTTQNSGYSCKLYYGTEIVNVYDTVGPYTIQ